MNKIGEPVTVEKASHMSSDAVGREKNWLTLNSRFYWKKIHPAPAQIKRHRRSGFQGNQA